jgi:putative FmdB family regulatory protein
MPTYEYRCPSGHEFDRFYKTISGAPTEVLCPECQAIASRRLSGGGGLMFKGSGFYLTDYGKNAHRKTEGQKGEGGKTEGQKSDAPKGEIAKAESKPDSAPKAESSASKAEHAKPKSDNSKKPKSE